MSIFAQFIHHYHHRQQHSDERSKIKLTTRTPEQRFMGDVDKVASAQEIIVHSLREIIEERRQEIIVHSLRGDFCGRTS